MQFLNTVGGVSAIRDIAWDGSAFSVNDERKVYRADSAPTGRSGLPIAAAVPRWRRRSGWAAPRLCTTTSAMRRAALGYQVTLAAACQRDDRLRRPADRRRRGPAASTADARRGSQHERRATASALARKTRPRYAAGSAAAQPLVDTLHTALAHILVTRDGPMLRPGTRSYARSWIRDGAMIAESLLRLGARAVCRRLSALVRAASIRRRQDPMLRRSARRRSGSRKTTAPGEFIFLAGEVYRYTTTARCSRRCGRTSRSRGVSRTLRHRAASGEPYAGMARLRRYGILPASISHEGYSAKPVHSYWDDFWALKGYDGAVDDRVALGHDEDAARSRGERDDFGADLAISFARRRARACASDYLPGAAELGRLRSDVVHHRLCAGRRRSRAAAGTRRADIRALLARIHRSRRDGKTSWDRLTRPTSFASSGVRAARLARARAGTARLSSSPTGALPPGTSGPKSSAATRMQPRFVGDHAARLGRFRLHSRGARPLRV